MKKAGPQACNEQIQMKTGDFKTDEFCTGFSNEKRASNFIECIAGLSKEVSESSRRCVRRQNCQIIVSFY